MVKSELNNTIVYNESKMIDNEDKGHSSSIYSIELEDQDIEIALGKEKYTFSDKNIVNYPIYFLNNNSIKEKIGIFEIESNDVINALYEDGDIDINKGNILFFSYITIQYLKNITKDDVKVDIEKIENYQDTISNSNKDQLNSQGKDNEKLENDEDEEDDEDDEDEDDDVTKVSNIKNKLVEVKEDDDLVDGIFIDNKNFKKKPLLKEEFLKDSQDNKNDYEDRANSEWINQFLKNNHFGVIDNDGGGDCFFASIRDAFEMEGKSTTIRKLRAIVSKKATDEIFMQYKSIYQSMVGELNTKERNMKDLRKTGKLLKSQHDSVTDKIEGQNILNNAKQNLSNYQKEELEKSEIQDLLDEFIFMQDIDTFEKFKNIIKTSEFWADTWAITTIEESLKIKVIILSEEAYYSGDLDSVMLCGQNNSDKDLINSTPEYYVMVSYTGNHYRLITYKEKGLLKFSEIPYDIKMLIVNKCMEKNSGPYYLLKDFRDLKMNLGLSSDEGIIEKDEYIDFELFDKDTVFMFYNKSDPSPKAGKGSGEKISDANIIEYNKLNKDKTLKDWRRKLDDSWKASFSLDNKRWATVDHYFYGSQFKKGFPDFYSKFSLDSNTDLSLDPKKAKAAASKKGKFEKKLIRPTNVTHDPDFFELGPDQRSIKERFDALTAKFSQNQDMKKVLLETKDAKLVKFIRSSPPEVDIQLMKVRKNLKNNP
tara:strand:+ start:3153 stop:5273 length:2121 start_codon:yes stop_codon:yes gene_type:complete